ncbi:MAG: glycosyl transferase family 39 [Cyanobacteria bacterium RYN_339]|nr:glycosyl transferase family 39 [Cyanobacteria bacterium RYN_339]
MVGYMALMDTWERRDTGYMLVLVGIFVIACLYDIRLIEVPVFDEAYTLPAVRSLLAGLPSLEVSHPPISKLGMALGTWLTGGSKDWAGIACGSRLASIVVGAVGLAAMYGIGFLTQGRKVAVLATILLGADGMYFVMSRTAMTNIYGVTFALLGALGLVLAVRRNQPAWVGVAGIAFGLAVASRWSAAVACIVLGGALLIHKPRWFPALVLAALGTYYLAFFPANPFQFVEAQRFMAVVHTMPLEPNPFNTPWWTLPLLLRPSWFYFGELPASHQVYGIFAVGNVWIWWLSVPALVWAVWQKNMPLRIAGVWGLAAWLIWAPGASNYLLTHYFFEAVPAACLAIAAVVARAGGPIMIAYMTLVLVWMVQFYPMLVGRPMSLPAYESRLLLGVARWDFAHRINDFHKELGLDTPQKIKDYEAKNAPSFIEYIRRVDEAQRRR